MKCARRARALALVFAFSAGAACSITGTVPAADALSHQIPSVHHSQFKLGIPQQSEVKVGQRVFHVTRAVLDASPDDVWNVLTDYENLAYYPNVRDFKVLSNAGDNKKVWFSIASMCGLWKFDYVLNIAESKPEHRIEWQRESGAFKVNEGSWTLEPVAEGRQTLVTYAKYMDGGILMPKMFLNSELKKSMPAVIHQLNSAVIKNKRVAHKPN